LPTDPSLIIYAAAFVEGTDLGAEGSGAITAISRARIRCVSPRCFAGHLRLGEEHPDASHQYYRRSLKVRADIAAAMLNDPNLPGGLIRL
jgi:hypothetical protein